MTEKERQTVAKAKTDEERQFKPFGVVVQEARAGVLHSELSEQFANLVAGSPVEPRHVEDALAR